MNPQVAIGVRPEADVADGTVMDAPRQIGLPAGGSPPAAALVRVNLEPCPPDSLGSNESLFRRLLALADVTGMGAALLLVLSRFGIDSGALVVVASMPLVVLFFKVAGLYNRDELRLGHRPSTRHRHCCS